MSKTITSDSRHKRLGKTILFKKSNQTNSTPKTSAKNVDKVDTNAAYVVSGTTSNTSSKLSDTLRAEILNNPNAVVDVIYPLLGKILKKYVAVKVKSIKANANVFKSKLYRFVGFSKNEKDALNIENEEAQTILQNRRPEIDMIMLIDKHSRYILSEFSKSLEIAESKAQSIHEAILQFIDNDLDNNNEPKHLEFENHMIHIQYFSDYYMAVILSGRYNWAYKDLLEDKLLFFAQRHIINSDLSDSERLTKKLSKYFRKMDLII